MAMICREVTTVGQRWGSLGSGWAGVRPILWQGSSFQAVVEKIPKNLTNPTTRRWWRGLELLGAHGKRRAVECVGGFFGFGMEMFQ